MKPYLVDVPVRIAIWIRRNTLMQQFNVIKAARPSTIFIQSDGGRTEEEWGIIRQNREMIMNGIDWDCDVHPLFHETNLGLYGAGRKSQEYIWDHVDRCVFLEDDDVPSVSYFRFCAELLEKYKDDERIAAVNGMNVLGQYTEPKSDYFFSRYGSIWGTATWKRVYDNWTNLDYADNPYIMKLLDAHTAHERLPGRQIRGYAKDAYFDGHPAVWEFQYLFAAYGYHQLQIIPCKNMIGNHGCDEKSAHSAPLKILPKGIQRLFNMETYELEFPLSHPKYVIPDVQYEKAINRILGTSPEVRLWRFVENGIRKTIYVDPLCIPKYIFRKIFKRKGKEIEK